MRHSKLIAVCSLIATVLCYSSPASAAILPGDIVSSPVLISGLVEGAAFTNVTVATFSDLNPGALADYTAAIHWGDGTTSPGDITSGGGGSFTVTGSHTYADEGNYSYSTDVTFSPLPLTAIGISETAGVADAALSLLSTAPPIPFTPGVPLSNFLLATFGDANPFGSVIDFTGMIDWGDGTQTPGIILAGSPGEFALEGSHTYAGGGSFPISIGIKDTGGASLRTTTTASSRSVPEPCTLALIGIGALGLPWLRRRKVNP
ncbi:PEP-CTERM sorting domain-containing protein [Fundidesulfovibrio terrae]|uniref:PEP-CTERM sorting domain-containing protein n=1 Tax=Fundidesulfovibrio terrae TaxID=2922866 RepID=UPI001FAEAA5D|nr:PEP-CTERM sorting domain-containing protein [Fundidesulfovibrio terrae]